jgi:alpha-galactosidase
LSSLITIKENHLNLVFYVTEQQELRFLHFSALAFQEDLLFNLNTKRFRLVELQVTGENHEDHHGSKYTGTSPANRLRYHSHQDYRNSLGRKLEFIQVDVDRLKVVSHFQFCDGIAVVRCWTVVENIGTQAIGLEYVSSFALTGISQGLSENWSQRSRLHLGHNDWNGEGQWRSYSLPELGLYPVHRLSVKRIEVSSTGSWPTGEYLSMALFENTEQETFLFWEIEHNGSWMWELGPVEQELYLQLSGPCEKNHHWWKQLEPGEAFCSVPVSIGSIQGAFDEAIGALTRYRRTLRRPNRDNETLPVIFNDYMNCLNADPTTEKLLPLIDTAARIGCEIFCVDAGWYGDGNWWDSVGEWLPSKKRFPRGFSEVFEHIRSQGMAPGLWLELEVMGIKCPLAKAWPDECFFMRHNQRVIDNGRYQLDFRHPMVLEHANSVMDRLIRNYGLGYIKMDYNINIGLGTDIDADSAGEGLLQHNRAYLAWLDEVLKRYPDLVIENCASGGMRMNSSLLSRLSIQSCSDQVDYKKLAVIAASCLTAVPPEQCATWSYPLQEADEEEVIFNMINAMLMRIHQSGKTAELPPSKLALVQEAIACYKTIRQEIPHALPFWPLGLPKFTDPWICLGLRQASTCYMAVWRKDTDQSHWDIPLVDDQGWTLDIECLYPRQGSSLWTWDRDSGLLTVSLPARNTARLFKIKKKI